MYDLTKREFLAEIEDSTFIKGDFKISGYYYLSHKGGLLAWFLEVDSCCDAFVLFNSMDEFLEWESLAETPSCNWMMASEIVEWNLLNPKLRSQNPTGVKFWDSLDRELSKIYEPN